MNGSTKEKQARSTLRRLLLFAGILLCTGSFMVNTSGCLPQPIMFQLANVYPCGENTGGGNTTKLVSGLADISLTGYRMTFGLQNWLTVNGDPSALRPETNYIQVKEAKIFFEYPANFSLKGSGGSELHTEQNPYIKKIFFRLDPTIEGDLQGLQAGAGGGGLQANENLLNLGGIIPPETIARLLSAAELKAATTGFKLEVLVHIQFSGVTLSGAELKTHELIFPLKICDGCLNFLPASLKKPKSACAEEIVEGESNDKAECVGSNDVCFKPKDN